MGNNPGPVGQVHNFSPAALIDPGGTAWEVWGAGSMTTGVTHKESLDFAPYTGNPIFHFVEQVHQRLQKSLDLFHNTGDLLSDGLKSGDKLVLKGDDSILDRRENRFDPIAQLVDGVSEGFTVVV